MKHQKDTIPVRHGEELDTLKLEKYLRAKLSDLPEGELHIEQFPSGHSNLTYQLTIGDWEAVLRRPPLGPVAAKAHDMEREYTILKTLHPHFKLAPKPFLYEDDESIVGSPFFVMERRHGIVVDTHFPEEMENTGQSAKIISETMVQTLARLHDIDYKKTEMATITKPEGFMERQVHGWIKRYQQAKTDEIPKVEELMNWLRSNIPTSSDATIIHYDFKCNNTMFNPNDLSEITGLFDWEMTTVGDPLADLGVTLSYWMEDSDPDFLKYGFGKPPITTKEGFYSRRQFAERYAELTGRDVSNLDFYLTFAYFKLAVIVQQIYYRYKKGQTSDARFSQFNQATAALITYAYAISQKGF
ncbi:phosphotransferase family protein [Aquibacillus halophilus]|uniref:phosphotransferase family protein n=1 Tax=Aquibacillus halophilus TaxID=930132 RepID=UPI003B83538A